jgi:hypothetical protein
MCCIEIDYQNVSPHERREMRTTGNQKTRMSLRSSGLAVPCVPGPLHAAQNRRLQSAKLGPKNNLSRLRS